MYTVLIASLPSVRLLGWLSESALFCVWLPFHLHLQPVTCCLVHNKKEGQTCKKFGPVGWPVVVRSIVPVRNLSTQTTNHESSRPWRQPKTRSRSRQQSLSGTIQQKQRLWRPGIRPRRWNRQRRRNHCTSATIGQRAWAWQRWWWWWSSRWSGWSGFWSWFGKTTTCHVICEWWCHFEKTQKTKTKNYLW